MDFGGYDIPNWVAVPISVISGIASGWYMQRRYSDWNKKQKRWIKTKDAVFCHMDIIRQESVSIQDTYLDQTERNRRQRIGLAPYVHDKIIHKIDRIKARLFEIEQLREKNRSFFRKQGTLLDDIQNIRTQVEGLDEKCNLEDEFKTSIAVVVGTSREIMMDLEDL